MQYNKTAPLDYEKWSKDFVQVAEKHVYKYNGTLIKSGTATNGKVVPNGYSANAKTVSQKQMAEAGMRLAVTLEKNL